MEAQKWNLEQLEAARRVSDYLENAKISKAISGGADKSNIRAAVETGEKAGLGETEEEIRKNVAEILKEEVQN